LSKLNRWLVKHLCSNKRQYQYYQQQPYQQQQTQTQSQQIAPTPGKYADLLPQLLKQNLVLTKAPPPVPARLPAGYRPDLFCDFHQGAPDHDIEHCHTMKNAAQSLIRTNNLTFWDLTPNVQANPLLTLQHTERLAAIGSLLMFFLLLICSNNFVCLFNAFPKKSFRPARDESEFV